MCETAPCQSAPSLNHDRRATKGAKRYRLDVPRNVSVIGFDDIQNAAYHHRALATEENGNDCRRSVIAQSRPGRRQLSTPNCDRAGIGGPQIDGCSQHRLGLRVSTPHGRFSLFHITNYFNQDVPIFLGRFVTRTERVYKSTPRPSHSLQFVALPRFLDSQEAFAWR